MHSEKKDTLSFGLVSSGNVRDTGNTGKLYESQLSLLSQPHSFVGNLHTHKLRCSGQPSLLTGMPSFHWQEGWEWSSNLAFYH